MSVSVLVAIVGVVVAGVATGVLVRRCVRRPAVAFVVWGVATAALTGALLAQGVGFATGFGPLTFRTVQLCAQLFAPLWLAWGLVERVAVSAAVRFGAKLVTGVLTIVPGVVLATDPLTVATFTRAWPAAAAHYQLIPHYLLIVVHLVVVVAAVAATGRWAVRARNMSGPAVAAPAGVCLAVLLTVALRFTLPVDSGYPACCAVAAGLVWLAATQPAARPRDRRDMQPLRGAAAMRGGRDPRRRRPTVSGSPPGSAERPGTARLSPSGMAVDGAPWVPDATAGGPAVPWEVAERPPVLETAGDAVRGRQPVSPPYGRIAIYTLLEDRVADFDRLAAVTADEVRADEPDTLVYVIHTVPKAPLQRIFYEVYRDRDAFEWHERQPSIRRFAAQRRPCVLATNVIELRLTHAKVSALAPTPAPQGYGAVDGGHHASVRRYGRI